MSLPPASYPALETREGIMSTNEPGPGNHGAPMDYQEHEKSYDLFVKGVKYGRCTLYSC